MLMQKNNAFCSICTVNYTSYAGVLNDSLKKAGHNEPHYVLVVDYSEKYKDIIEEFDFVPVFLDDLKLPQENELIEKYNAFELSNVLKPFFMEWLLNKDDIDYLFYLDTDIYVYSQLNDILEVFLGNPDISVLLTPHILDYDVYRNIDDYKIEAKLFNYGLYNGGFYMLKNDLKSKQFLRWHKAKLFNYGYDNNNSFMFVDQKILDLAPVLFEYVRIYKNKLYNVAFWNYFERKINDENGKYLINGGDVVFFHFSNLIIKEDDIDNARLSDILLRNEPILKKMAFAYWESLNLYGLEKIKAIPYGFKDRYKGPKKIELDVFPSKKVKNFSDDLDHDFLKLKKELEIIYNSWEWRIALVLQKIVKKIAPRESNRRKIFFKIWNLAKVASSSFPKKIKSFFLKLFFKVLCRIKLKKKRRINLNSKKVVFIGHSYHKKTKSSEFLINYLRDFFEVEVVFDESWQGKGFVDLSFIDKSYLAVIFWQNIPNPRILKNINNDNIIFFPMYDAVVGLGGDFWKSYRHLKIVSFSKTLHEKLNQWKFESMFIHFFPRLGEFSPGDSDSVFFWQRVENININIIKKLFAGKKMKLHVHKAVDPGHKFIQPGNNEVEEFRITYSDWFETREEMWKAIEKVGIYIAPREYEGIGMSFLEAMAMGKAVVAVNNPTMNEYIKNGENGYLFDPKNPKEIDLSCIRQVQKNTYKFMQEGFEKWEKEKIKIIDFIKK